jgi:hypothetical protein
LWNNPAQKENHECNEEKEELEQFINADLKPIQASESFKENLRKKLWRFLQDK